MLTWLKLLPLELGSISEMAEPEPPVGENDKVVGEMSESVRQLFTLAFLLEKDARQSRLDSDYCTDKVAKRELRAKAIEYAAKTSFIRYLMWIEVRETFGLWEEPVGVRAGFKVVITPDEKDDDLPPFFKRLLGGGL